MVKIGIIGGSGLENPKILQDPSERDVDTPYGKPSSALITGKIEGVEIEGEMRTHKIWVSELSDDDRVTRIYEMAPPVSTQRFVLPAHFGQIPAV